MYGKGSAGIRRTKWSPAPRSPGIWRKRVDVAFVWKRAAENGDRAANV